MRQLPDVVELLAQAAVVPSAGPGGLGPSVVDCPRLQSSAW